MGRAGVRPAVRLMTVVLSNGATLKMPTAAVRTKPYIATQVRAARASGAGGRAKPARHAGPWGSAELRCGWVLRAS
jgi:hypothetical protein